jgi:flagellar biosynthesis chaperone FliJ
LLTEGKYLEQHMENTDKELSLSQQMVKDLEARMHACIHGNLQTRHTELKQRLASRMPTNLDEVRQELKDTQEQLKIMHEERNEYWDQVKGVLVRIDIGSGNGGGKNI